MSRIYLSSEELAQNGRGVKRSARRSGEFLFCLAARIRALCAFEELAQNGHGVGRAARRSEEFLPGLAARTRALCAFMSLCLLILSGCSASHGAADSAPEGPSTPVQVTPAKQRPIQRVITAEAVLYPVKQANIIPKISAPVQRFLAQRGDHVRAGQLLAVLEDRDLEAAAAESNEMYRQAQAAYQNTTAGTMPEDLTKAKADVESARQGWEAAKKLYVNREALLHEGALAQKLVDDAKVAMVQAKSQYDTAQQHLTSLETVGRVEQTKSTQAQVDAAKAHYQGSAAQVAYAQVRSPISGIVSDRPLQIGEMASAGSAIFSIVDISRAVARANIPVHEAASIQAGNQATIRGPGGAVQGKVTVVSPAVDPSTTTVEVWVEAPNQKEVLKPGTTVQIDIQVGEIPDAIVVPSSALLASEEGGEKVMLAGADSLAHSQKVESGIRSGDDVQILRGVKAGDQVITEGALGLDDKAKIQIAKPDDTEAGGTKAEEDK